jgi:hypothetical protein
MSRSLNDPADDPRSDFGVVTLDADGASKLALALWLYIPVNVNNDLTVLQFDVQYPNSSGFDLSTNASPGASYFYNYSPGGTSFINSKFWTRASEDTWHHFVINVDRALAGNAEITSVYIDGSSQSLTDEFTADTTANFPNATLYIGARDGTSRFERMLIAQFSAVKGQNYTATDAAHLAAGRLANYPGLSVQPTQWNLIGADGSGAAIIGNNIAWTGGAAAADPPGLDPLNPKQPMSLWHRHLLTR